MSGPSNLDEELSGLLKFVNQDDAVQFNPSRMRIFRFKMAYIRNLPYPVVREVLRCRLSLMPIGYVEDINQLLIYHIGTRNFEFLLPDRVVRIWILPVSSLVGEAWRLNWKWLAVATGKPQEYALFNVAECVVPFPYFMVSPEDFAERAKKANLQHTEIFRKHGLAEETVENKTWWKRLYEWMLQ